MTFLALDLHVFAFEGITGVFEVIKFLYFPALHRVTLQAISAALEFCSKTAFMLIFMARKALFTIESSEKEGFESGLESRRFLLMTLFALELFVFALKRVFSNF